MALSKIVQNSIDTSVVGTGPVFSTQRTTTSTIAPATWTKVLLDTTNYDTNSFVSLPGYRVTPTIGGHYQLTASANWGAGSGTTIVSVRLNGGEYMRMARTSLSSTDETNNCYSCLMPINGTTDYIELWVYHSNASNMTLYNGTLQGALVRKS